MSRWFNADPETFVLKDTMKFSDSSARKNLIATLTIVSSKVWVTSSNKVDSEIL